MAGRRGKRKLLRDRRRNPILIYLTDAERLRLEQAADAEGITLSECVRRALAITHQKSAIVEQTDEGD